MVDEFDDADEPELELPPHPINEPATQAILKIIAADFFNDTFLILILHSEAKYYPFHYINIVASGKC